MIKKLSTSVKQKMKSFERRKDCFLSQKTVFGFSSIDKTRTSPTTHEIQSKSDNLAGNIDFPINKSSPLVKDMPDLVTLPTRLLPETHSLRDLNIELSEKILNLSSESNLRQIRKSYEDHMNLSNPFSYKDMNVI
jgi:hypothetical protein